MTVAKVAKPLGIKTKEMEEQENVALKSFKYATKKAYPEGYKEALVKRKMALNEDSLNKTVIEKIIDKTIKDIERENK